MKTKPLAPALVLALTLPLVGCSYLGVNFTDDKAQYETSVSRAPLSVPPDLSDVPLNDRYAVPQQARVVSARAEAARDEQAAAAVGDRPAPLTGVLPQTRVATVMRDGQARYVHVLATAEQVWPVLVDFWASVGLQLVRQDESAGVMQTEWAENKANLPRDAIRAALGKVLDFVYDTGERDQFRARVERDGTDACDIFVTHRQMVEVLRNKQEDSTIWQPGASDPQLEAEMLTRIAQRLEREFNPEVKTAAEKQIDVLSDLKYEPKSEVLNDASGQAEAVLVKEDFDRAWRLVGVALDRASFDVTDRDRSQGLIMVKYLDPDYEKVLRRQQGMFNNVFRRDRAVDVPSYQIRLAPDGPGRTRVTVSGPDGQADQTGVAPSIVTLIGEQTN